MHLIRNPIQRPTKCCSHPFLPVPVFTRCSRLMLSITGVAGRSNALEQNRSFFMQLLIAPLLPKTFSLSHKHLSCTCGNLFRYSPRRLRSPLQNAVVQIAGTPTANSGNQWWVLPFDEVSFQCTGFWEELRITVYRRLCRGDPLQSMGANIPQGVNCLDADAV